MMLLHYYSHHRPQPFTQESRGISGMALCWFLSSLFNWHHIFKQVLHFTSQPQRSPRFGAWPLPFDDDVNCCYYCGGHSCNHMGPLRYRMEVLIRQVKVVRKMRRWCPPPLSLFVLPHREASGIWRANDRKNPSTAAKLFEMYQSICFGLFRR